MPKGFQEFGQAPEGELNERILIRDIERIPEGQRTRNLKGEGYIRLVFFKIRGGDYAHPGDEEAIKLVLKDVQSKYNLSNTASILDVGCGFGGTLGYLQDDGFSHLHGVDIDPVAIEHALQYHRGIDFKQGDALQLSQVFPNQSFSLITFFSVMYALEDKDKALGELTKISRSGSLLMLFDYTVDADTNAPKIYDFSGKKMFPLQPLKLQNSLENHGWTVLEVKDVSDKFITWYQDFLKKLEEKKPDIVEEFSKESYSQVHQTFSHLLKYLKNKQMGGMILYAQKR